MGLVEAGTMHRLAVAVEDSDAASAWWQRVFGTAPVTRVAIPHESTESAAAEQSTIDDMRAQEGSDSRMVWHGGYPLLFLAPWGEDGYVHRHLRRWGTGLHSLAWEIEDMWGADASLRAAGYSITGVNIAGRHFFLHPRETHGVMLEFTDTYFEGDVRRGGPRPDESGGLIEGAQVAWVTAVVADADATADLLAEVANGIDVSDNPRRAESVETTRDVQVGDLVVRLVTPRSDQSLLEPVLAGGPRLYSYALRVPNLDAALGVMEAEGAAVLVRDGDLAWTDPAGTFGVPLEWVSA
jgi:4-hydroxyphenylpyruvate dioxygenase-like putative hemolysin